MVWYIKTICPDSILLPFVKKEVYINSAYAVADIKLTEYLKKEYNLTVFNILRYVYSNLRADTVEPNLHQIYIIDQKVTEKAKLNDLLKVLEYGSLDIKPNRIVSKLMNTSIEQVKNHLGGI